MPSTAGAQSTPTDPVRIFWPSSRRLQRSGTLRFYGTAPQQDSFVVLSVQADSAPAPQGFSLLGLWDTTADSGPLSALESAYARLVRESTEARDASADAATPGSLQAAPAAPYILCQGQIALPRGGLLPSSLHIRLPDSAQNPLSADDRARPTVQVFTYNPQDWQHPQLGLPTDPGDGAWSLCLQQLLTHTTNTAPYVPCRTVFDPETPTPFNPVTAAAAAGFTAAAFTSSHASAANENHQAVTQATNSTLHPGPLPAPTPASAHVSAASESQHPTTQATNSAPRPTLLSQSQHPTTEATNSVPPHTLLVPRGLVLASWLLQWLVGVCVEVLLYHYMEQVASGVRMGVRVAAGTVSTNTKWLMTAHPAGIKLHAELCEILGTAVLYCMTLLTMAVVPYATRGSTDVCYVLAGCCAVAGVSGGLYAARRILLLSALPITSLHISLSALYRAHLRGLRATWRMMQSRYKERRGPGAPPFYAHWLPARLRSLSVHTKPPHSQPLVQLGPAAAAAAAAAEAAKQAAGHSAAHKADVSAGDNVLSASVPVAHGGGGAAGARRSSRLAQQATQQTVGGVQQPAGDRATAVAAREQVTQQDVVAGAGVAAGDGGIDGGAAQPELPRVRDRNLWGNRVKVVKEVAMEEVFVGVLLFLPLFMLLPSTIMWHLAACVAQLLVVAAAETLRLSARLWQVNPCLLVLWAYIKPASFPGTVVPSAVRGKLDVSAHIYMPTRTHTPQADTPQAAPPESQAADPVLRRRTRGKRSAAAGKTSAETDTHASEPVHASQTESTAQQPDPSTASATTDNADTWRECRVQVYRAARVRAPVGQLLSLWYKSVMCAEAGQTRQLWAPLRAMVDLFRAVGGPRAQWCTLASKERVRVGSVGGVVTAVLGGRALWADEWLLE